MTFQSPVVVAPGTDRRHGLILDAAPDGFETAASVDPLALGALLADLAGIDGRHVIVADAAGEHRLWLREVRIPGQPLAAVVPLDKDFHHPHRQLVCAFTAVCSARRQGPSAALLAAHSVPDGAPRPDAPRARPARRTGATYRQIAVELGREEAARLPATEWKISAVALVRGAAGP